MVNVFGPEAHADDAAGELLEAGDAGEDAERERSIEGPGIVQDAVDDLVGAGLQALRAQDGGLALGLNRVEMVAGEGAGAEWISEEVGGGDGVLDREVDADAADGRHGVGGVADAEEAGAVPAARGG